MPFWIRVQLSAGTNPSRRGVRTEGGVSIPQCDICA